MLSKFKLILYMLYINIYSLLRFNYVMDCKESVWILTNVSNIIIEKKLITLFSLKKIDVVITKSIFTEKILYMCKMFSCYL